MRFAFFFLMLVFIVSFAFSTTEDPISVSDAQKIKPTLNTITSKDDEAPDASYEKIKKSFGNLPLYFIENKGQLDDRAAYYLKGADRTLYFKPDGMTISLYQGDSKNSKRWIMNLDFIDAEQVRPKGEKKQKTVFSYFKGKPSEWQRGVSTYGKLLYSNLWPGVDLVYYGKTNRLKYEFILKAGADPSKVRLRYSGVLKAHIQPDGSMKVETPLGDLQDQAPYAYQTVDNKKREVSIEYSLRKEAEKDTWSFGFNLGAYDKTAPLVLDPGFIIYCGYIGGGNEEHGYCIDVDSEGRTYITGFTRSTETWDNFPIKTGPDLTYNGGGQGDAFVARVNAKGTDLDYCGYIGGTDSDQGKSIAVDLFGRAYITGYTYSNETTEGFPVKVGPDMTLAGTKDAFVARVNPQGTDLEYCGYIGGSDNSEIGHGTAVDTMGRAYVVGETTSDEVGDGFPVKVGPDLTYNGGIEGFIARVNATGSDLEYCGYIGGASVDQAVEVAVDASFNAYITGYTESSEAVNFPVIMGPDLTYNYDDAFVAKVSPTGSGFLYCGYIGGTDTDIGKKIAVDSGGRAYVGGWTASDNTSESFPVITGPDLTFNGGATDAFVARVSASGAMLEYCGYIGGTENERGYSVAVDLNGRAYVTGFTYSNEGAHNFPVKVGPDLTSNGYQDAFIARVDATGSSLEYCGYIGGDFYDEGFSVAADKWGNAYVTGHTVSSEATFPVVTGPDLTFNMAYDAFIAKVCMALTADLYKIPESSGGTVNFNLDAGVGAANRNYILLGCVTGTSPGTPLPGNKAVLPLNMDLFTNLVLGFINGPIFSNFMGALDSNGEAQAALNTFGPLPTGSAGLTIYFAFAVNKPWEFASNWVDIVITP